MANEQMTTPPDPSAEDMRLAGEIASIWCNCFTGKAEPDAAVKTIDAITTARRAEREKIVKLKSEVNTLAMALHRTSNESVIAKSKLTLATAALELVERALKRAEQSLHTADAAFHGSPGGQIEINKAYPAIQQAIAAIKEVKGK